jgi:hypothetical protein
VRAPTRFPRRPEESAEDGPVVEDRYECPFRSVSQGFGQDLGYHGLPFRWDPARRNLLRAELDAACFHIYGVERDDIDYVMESFPIVKKKDMALFGEYRTKRMVLECFEAIAEAKAAKREYETVLYPRPAHPSLSHLESTRPAS